MKRMILLILAALLLCACSAPQDPGSFYYRNDEIRYDGSNGVIASEVRDIAQLRADPDALWAAYFSGPEDADLVSPFPRDTQVISWKQDGGTLLLQMNHSFSELSGIDLTVACSCIARTAFDIIGVDAVQIYVDGALLNGAQQIEITSGQLHLADDSADRLQTDLTLYYADDQLRYLSGYDISINPATQENIAAHLVELLMEAPAGYDMVSVIPRETKLLDCTVADGTCTLDFSQEFESNAYYLSYAQRLTLMSIVNTLTQLEDVDRVEFYVEGSMIVHYRNLSISKPLVFDESAIGPVRTAVNEFDATLYVSNGSDLYLASVPTRLRQGAGFSQAELVVDALIHYDNPNGFYSSIPKDTAIRSVSIREGVCYIDLSREFLAQQEHLYLSVHSLVASVCSLEGIEQAQVTVEGTVPQGNYGDLFEPLSPGSDWYL